MRKIVYLGGPINGCTDEEAHGWRDALKPELEKRGFIYLDPMVRDYRGREDEAWREIVEEDKKDIGQADILLMNCPKPSVGTSMEIFLGWRSNKKIIAVVPERASVSPWLRYHVETTYGGGYICHSTKEALEAL